MHAERMKKNDWILAAGLLLAALCIYLFQSIYRGDGSFVVVSVDGRETGVYSLTEDKTLDIEGYGGGTCRLVIADGAASVSVADCPDKLCVHQGKISRQGETIACLPNRILIFVRGGSAAGYDAVAD